MYDSNLMLLDAETVTGTGAAVVSAYLDTWAENADAGPQFSEYEVAAPPGAGNAVRELTWQLILTDPTADLDEDVVLTLEWSNDGSGAADESEVFPTVLAADVVAGAVRRLRTIAKARFVRSSFAAITAAKTFVATLGPVDAPEYTDGF